MEFAAQNLTVGQLNALVKIVGGEAEVKKLLRGLSRVVPNRHAFYEGKKISLGTGFKTVDEFRDAILQLGMVIITDASDILQESNFQVAAVPTEIDLVVMSGSELGVHEGDHYFKIVDKARRLGLKLCSIEMALMFRLSYMDQPEGETLIIGMQGFKTRSYGFPLVLTVENRAGKTLLGTARGEGFFSDTNLFVFVRPRPNIVDGVVSPVLEA